MGKLADINGQLSGLVGTVVVSSWKGIKYVKHKGRRSTKPRTDKQLAHQSRMGMMSTFLYRMKGLLEQSFAGYAIRQTGTNAAVSYNLKNAFIGNIQTKRSTIAVCC